MCGSTVARQALATIRRHGLFVRGDRVVAAVSGGPDSMALLEVLVELRERLGLWVCVAHLNHGLRGAEAEADAAFVATRAAQLGLDARLETADVGAERRLSGGSVEAVARRVRYAFFERVVEEVGATKVAVGHTADDQVETILEGLLRGGGLRALCGMPVSRRLSASSHAQVVRPLIGVRREEVLAWLGERGVGYRIDASNADPSFERNAVRHELLPVLEARLGEGLRGELLRLAERARTLAAVVGREAEGLVAKRGDGTALDVARLAEQPRLVRRAAVRCAFERAGGAGELRRRAIDAVEGLLEGGSGREVALGGGVVARRSYGELRVAMRDGAPPVACVPLAVPGRVEVSEVGLWVEAEEIDAGQGHPAYGTGGAWEEVVDLGRVGERLVVRTRRAGDRFEPLGAGGSRKLKDFLIDARVPREARVRTLVVEGQAGIVWVVGLRLDERAKVRPDTRRVARLRAGPLESE